MDILVATLIGLGGIGGLITSLYVFDSKMEKNKNDQEQEKRENKNKQEKRKLELKVIKDEKERVIKSKDTLFWVEAINFIRNNVKKWNWNNEESFQLNYEEFDIVVKNISSEEFKVSFSYEGVLAYNFEFTHYHSGSSYVSTDYDKLDELRDFDGIILKEFQEIMGYIEVEKEKIEKNKWDKLVEEHGINEEELKNALYSLKEPEKFYKKTSRTDSKICIYESEFGGTTVQVIDNGTIRVINIKEKDERIAHGNIRFQITK